MSRLVTNMLRFSSVLLIAALVVALSAAPPAGAQVGCSVPTGGLRPDAPEYAAHGSQWAGFTEFTVDDPDRPLSVAMWYPALNAACAEPFVYPLLAEEMGAGWLFLQGTFPRQGQAIQDAPPDPARGPYPLVVFSPRWWGHRYSGLWLAEHLASRGYVVMSAAPEDGAMNAIAGRSAMSRVKDLGRLIDQAETMNASGAYAGMIGTDRVTAIGSLWGDVAAAQIAGARLNPDYAGSHPGSGMFFQSVAQLKADITSALGAEPESDGLWPSLADPRVQAVVMMSAEGAFFGEDGLKTLTVPTLILGAGKADEAEGVGPAAMYGWSPAQAKAVAVFEHAGTAIFELECVNRGAGATDGMPYDNCSDDVWDLDRVHDIANHLVTAFLEREVKDVRRACRSLMSVASFELVPFKSTIRCN